MHEPTCNLDSPRWWWIWLASAITLPIASRFALVFAQNIPADIGELIWLSLVSLSVLGAVVSSIVLAQHFLYRWGPPHPIALVGVSLLFMVGAVVLMVVATGIIYHDFLDHGRI
jgi:branched-subunit amino acid transport protein